MEKNNKKWKIASPIPADISSNLDPYPQIFRQILYNRHIENESAAKDFLGANKPLYDPGSLKDIQKAAELIHQTIQDKGRFVVFGDYDVDGVTSTALLVQLLKKYGADVRMYIPNRFEEGYGFSLDALREVVHLKPDLIITVDCGVRSIKEVQIANEHGIKTIVTDHHQPFNELPQAAAIICPHQPDDNYPNKYLAGVGIAYKLAEYFMTAFPLEGESCQQWLDLVALGTVADLAPLNGENRVLVRGGIEQIRADPRPGVRALSNVSGFHFENLNAQHIGFMLGPRLNAAGRLSTAEKSCNLLMAAEIKAAGKMALDLDTENNQRRSITRKIQQSVEENYDFEKDQWLILFANEEFNEGVIGLAASKLADTYYRPSVIGVEKEDYIRASCRSIPELNITAALDKCMDLLEQHGGHAMAAGLTVKKKHLVELKNRLSAIIAEELTGSDLSPVMNAEIELHLGNLHPSLLKYLNMLEPTGAGNPSPLFVSREAEIRHVRAVGQHKDHLKMTLSDSRVNENSSRSFPVVIDAIAFRFGHLAEHCKVGDHIDILYSYELNTYNGRQNVQLNIRDIHVK